MKEAGPYIAIVALLITLGGALYGWATTQGVMQAQVLQLQKDVTALQMQVNGLQVDFQGTRLEITRWMAAHENVRDRR